MPLWRGGAKNVVFNAAESATVPRMKKLFAALIFAGAAAVALAQPYAMNAAAVAKGGHFVKLEQFDIAKVLPAPPAPGSLAAQADLEAVLQAQARRTPEQVAWAKFISADEPFKHAGVLGAWFTGENLPVTAAFLKDVTEDVNAVGALTKKLHARLRPPLVDARVRPCLPVPETAAYPSGHAMRAYAWALVLAEIFPEQRDALLARAQRAAWSRVLAACIFRATPWAGGCWPRRWWRS
jgi:hypothetical protein